MPEIDIFHTGFAWQLGSLQGPPWLGFPAKSNADPPTVRSVRRSSERQLPGSPFACAKPRPARTSAGHAIYRRSADASFRHLLKQRAGIVAGTADVGVFHRR